MKRFLLAVLTVILLCTLQALAFAKGEDTIITLSDNASTVTGEGATVDGNRVTITKGGEYRVTGTLTDGQLVVDVGKEAVVEIKLAGVSITCTTSAPIFVISADKVEIKLIDSTENTLVDTFRNDPVDSPLPGACLYSADDLTIKGTGRLTVFGNNNNGIATKNDLKINGGIITVTALNNALRGKDSVSIGGGRVTINGCEDGIKSNEEVREDKGFVTISGAMVTITASDDAVQAVRSVTIKDSLVVTYAEDLAVNCAGTVDIAQGCLIEN